jgi:hypothetical protein
MRRRAAALLRAGALCAVDKRDFLQVGPFRRVVQPSRYYLFVNR